MPSRQLIIRRDSDWRRLAPPRHYCRRSRTSARLRELPRRQVLLGDATAILRTLPAGSIDCVVTSPPYFLLRNYGHGQQIGLETTINEYVRRLVAVMGEVARVLKPTGSLWLNLGDSYSRNERYGAMPKAMLLGPERILLALSQRGWIVRNKVVWAKPNPMPTSARDRLTCSWEVVYFLVRSAHYYFDLDAIREPHRSKRTPRRRPPSREKYSGNRPHWAGPLAGANDGLIRAHAEGRVGHRLGKNPGDVWSIAKARYRGAHFATFPPTLLTKPVLASCPERVCDACGTPWMRRPLRAACTCAAGWQPGLVLDPFFGAGTTALEAERLGRDWIGIELNPEYQELALSRLDVARQKRGEVMQANERSKT
jgi:site-specific DNA-methyltransferase (adenine-specific)